MTFYKYTTYTIEFQMKSKLFFLFVFILFTLNPSAQNSAVNSQFIKAVKEHNCIDAELIIKKGVDVNLQDSLGKTPLMLAASTGDLRMSYLLYKNKANLNLSDNLGRNANTLAKIAGFLRVEKFILNPKSYSLHPTFEEYLIMSNLYKSKLDYQRAILFGEKANLASTCELSANHRYKSIVTNNLALLYELVGNYVKAEPLFLESVNIDKSVFGEMHPNYAIALNNLANFYVSMGKLSNVEPLYLESMKIRRAVFGENSTDYAGSLNDLANLYNELGDYYKAVPLLIESMNTRKVVLGINHPDYALSLTNLATLYQAMDSFARAEPLFLEAIKIRKNFGENTLDYASLLYNLASLYTSIGNYSKTEPLLLNVISIRKTLLGDNSIDYVSALNSLASLYQNKGEYSKAEPIYIESIKITKALLGEMNRTYASSLHNLASLYYLMGKYSMAEPLYLDGIRIRKVLLGETSSEYGNSLDGIAGLYKMIGNYNKAEYFYLEAIKLSKENSLDYAITTNNLASLYEQMGSYSKAEPLYIESIRIIKIILGEMHPDYAGSINNLAGLYRSMGNYSKSEELFMKSLHIREEIVGKMHPDYAASLNNLAMLYESIANFSKAEPLFVESIRKRKAVLGSTHPAYAVSLYNLFKHYILTNNYSEAETLMFEYEKIIRSNIKKNFNFLSENERELYWQTIKDKFNDTFPSFTYSYHPKKTSISTFAYDNTLFTKGLLLNTSLQIQNAVLQSGDSLLINTWGNLRDLKCQINLLQTKPLGQQGDLRIIEAHADSLDKVLTKKSQLYKQSTTDIQVKWTDVQNNLKPDEAAIEFISFNYFNKHYTDSTIYCALVLKKSSKYPEMIPLFEEKQLDSLFVKSGSDANQLYDRAIYHHIKDSAESSIKYGSKLYNLIWKPLEGGLKNMKTVYYAPSGKLNKVAFAAIPIDSTFLLSDKYKLHQVTSTRQILNINNNKTTKIKKAALFGGINYELDYKEASKVQLAQNKSLQPTFVSDSTQRSNTFRYLIGTAEEVNGISETFSKKGLKDFLYTGIIASEATFKKLNGTPIDIIHIATHGFYLPVEESKRQEMRFMGMDNESRNVVVKNPLLRSGLAFAGANRVWRGDSIPDNWEDGILTSHEISQINLTHTDLVVLSACETALGDIKGSEGVFGLQRAFKLAGVQTLIMSLWKVPDAQTSQLMQGFYKYWLGGMSKHDAFTKAQNEVRKANPKDFNSWAGFVMVD
jgi:CHAT domain-containing protein